MVECNLIEIPADQFIHPATLSTRGTNLPYTLPYCRAYICTATLSSQLGSVCGTNCPSLSLPPRPWKISRWGYRASISYVQRHIFYLFFYPLTRPRPAGGIECSGLSVRFTYVGTSVRPSVRSKIRLRFFTKVESQIKIKNVYGCKLIFHMRIYLYETSRNIQEPWYMVRYISWSTDFGLCPDYQD